MVVTLDRKLINYGPSNEVQAAVAIAYGRDRIIMSISCKVKAMPHYIVKTHTINIFDFNKYVHNMLLQHCSHCYNPLLDDNVGLIKNRKVRTFQKHNLYE